MGKEVLSNYTKKDFGLLQSNTSSFYNPELSKRNFSLVPKANGGQTVGNAAAGVRLAHGLLKGGQPGNRKCIRPDVRVQYSLFTSAGSHDR